MRSVRRLYFYLVSLISVEVVTWGVITLLWYALLRQPLAGSSYLATGMSLVLVGLPIFLLHWWVVQRRVNLEDEEEHFSRLRALFLYVIRLATLIPALQNLIALINRPILYLAGQDMRQALVGANDTWLDNLAVILVNLVVWYYFERILRREWKDGWVGSVLAEVRRFSRYVWMLYGLGLTLMGVEQVISFILYSLNRVSYTNTIQLANALPLLLVGVPLWVYSWRVIQTSLDDQEERFSGLRMGVLYLLALLGCIATLSTAAYTLASLLRWIMGDYQTLAEFLIQNNTPLASAVTLGVVWAYFGTHLRATISARRAELAQAELLRPYHYILSLLGNAAAYVGLWMLLITLAELILEPLATINGLRTSFAGSLAAVAVGLPVWLYYWKKVQSEAGQVSDLGDHARRSVVRKIYLYFAIFATVVAGMVTAGMLFYLVLNTLLGNPKVNFWLEFTQLAFPLLLTAVWLTYHIRTIVQDGRLAQQALSQRHAAFPVLALFERADTLSEELQAAIQKQTPLLPFTLHTLENGLPPSEQNAARLLVLPAGLLTQPADGLAAWLQGFTGQRLILPIASEDWLWQGAPQGLNPRDLAQQTAQSIRRLAEGQPLRSPGLSSTWLTVVYILAGIFALQFLLGILGFVLSLVIR